MQFMCTSGRVCILPDVSSNEGANVISPKKVVESAPGAKIVDVRVCIYVRTYIRPL